MPQMTIFILIIITLSKHFANHGVLYECEMATSRSFVFPLAILLWTKKVTIYLTCSAQKPVFSEMGCTPFGFFEFSSSIDQTQLFLEWNERLLRGASSNRWVLSDFAWVGTEVSQCDTGLLFLPPASSQLSFLR